MDSIFTQILKGNISCYPVFEDAYTFAFLDIEPLSLGHTLVIPKEQVAHFHELSLTSAEALGKSLCLVAKAI